MLRKMRGQEHGVPAECNEMSVIDVEEPHMNHILKEPKVIYKSLQFQFMWI